MVNESVPAEKIKISIKTQMNKTYIQRNLTKRTRYISFKNGGQSRRKSILCPVFIILQRYQGKPQSCPPWASRIPREVGLF